MTDVEKLARYFAALIRAEYSADELAEVIRRNATPHYVGSCATHDFRDSNAYMFGAWSAMHFESPDLTSESTIRTMGMAWDIARESGFSV